MRLLLALLLLTFSLPASAKESNFHYFRWYPEKADLPKEPIWFKKREAILSTRLAPAELFAVDGDVRDVKGRLLLPAGAQMVVVAALDRKILCNFTYQGNDRFRSAKKRICIEDRDLDGLFDEYYVSSVAYGRFLAMQENIRKRRTDLATRTTVSLISPDEMTDQPKIVIFYERILDAGNFFSRTLERAAQSKLPKNATVARFFVEVGGDQKRIIAAGGCSEEAVNLTCASTDFPSEIEFWGLKVRLLEREKDNLLLEFTENFKPVLVSY